MSTTSDNERAVELRVTISSGDPSGITPYIHLIRGVRRMCVEDDLIKFFGEADWPFMIVPREKLISAVWDGT